MGKKIVRNLKDRFVISTSVLSLLLSVLCIWKGVQTGFEVWGWIIITMNFLYVPLALFCGKKAFPYFYLAYSAVLIFVTAFDRTLLYNNYTALFMTAIVVMLYPKMRWVALVFYFALVSVAFCINGELLVNFFIHVVRSLWFIGIVEYVLNDKFRRKKLILYEDERNIIEQLCTGMVYQKEVVGFSENTIYRKLKAARERNGNISREELVKRYREEKDEQDLSF